MCVLLQVKYKEKYEREKGKPMLDFETPTYVTAKEAQHMQSQVNTLSVSSVVQMSTKATHCPLPSSLSAQRLFSACYILTCTVCPLLCIDMLQLVGCHAIVYVRITLLQCLEFQFIKSRPCFGAHQGVCDYCHFYSFPIFYS